MLAQGTAEARNRGGGLIQSARGEYAILSVWEQCPLFASYCVRYGDTKLITIRPCLQEAHSLLVEDG